MDAGGIQRVGAWDFGTQLHIIEVKAAVGEGGADALIRCDHELRVDDLPIQLQP